VFIDDHRPNVEAARQLGFRAIEFTDPEDLRAQLRDLGLLGNGSS
jgi:hypothetical protein